MTVPRVDIADEFASLAVKRPPSPRHGEPGAVADSRGLAL